MSFVDADQVKIFAHRGFSSRHPESTRAAYEEAIAFAATEGCELGLECDVHFAADDELIVLHDLTLDRTSDATGPVFARSCDELRRVDFGAWGRWRQRPAAARTTGDHALISLAELFELTSRARREGTPVSLTVETKHPNPRGFAVDDRLVEMIIARGWDQPVHDRGQQEPPVRVISFNPASLNRLGALLPGLCRTYLVERSLAPVVDGRLPEGIDIVGVDHRLLRRDPDFVARARRHGNETHVWTVNQQADIDFCLDLGVTGLTTDYPDRVVDVLRGRGRGQSARTGHRPHSAINEPATGRAVEGARIG